MRKLDDRPLTRIDGSATTLGAYRGKVLLIVNVASKCGLTPQYTGLERLYEAKAPQGLEIIEPAGPGEVSWNFEKFLIDRSLAVVDRFAPDVTPEDPRLLAAVDRELARSA